MRVPVRWKKLARDLRLERGRMLLMSTALAVSLFGLGAVLGAYAILTREIRASYLASRPAAAALQVDRDLDAPLIEDARRQPGIAEATAGEIVTARVKVGEDWRPLLLFVADDFEHLRLNVFRRESGAWPPPLGTLLIERTAVAVLRADEGDTVTVKPPSGPAKEMRIVGRVHDQGLAPAWQEEEGYGYITRETLAWLGETGGLRELRFTLSDGTVGGPFERAAIERAAIERTAIEAKVAEMAQWLSTRGFTVSEARVPPPGRHPHQTQMYGVLFLLLSFSGMALVLSGVLVATSLAGLLARQVREIGVMKTLGARTAQIFGLYVGLLVVLGTGALVLALPTGVLGARGLAGMSARMLNLQAADLSVPLWVFFVQAAAGIVVPLAVAAFPVGRSASRTVREALDEYGATGPAPRATRRREAKGTLARARRWGALIVRNALRRRTRLFLTLSLLAAGGAVFMSAKNLVGGWGRIVARVYENRSYDVEIRLDARLDARPGIVAQLAAVPGVKTVEAWGYAPCAFARPGQIDIVRTYPDGGHGSFTLMAPPADTQLVHFPLRAGRWLRNDDTDAVVLSHMALAQAPDSKVGGTVLLSFGGRATTWRVVGIVEEVGAAGIAYVTRESFARLAGASERVSMVRIATSATTAAERLAVIRRLEATLDQAQARVKVVIPLALLRTAMGDHVIVLTRLLLAMAGMMITVGTLGLASTMSAAVIERTRELAIMKTLGASPTRIALLMMGEALFMSVLSWGLAVVLSLPLSLGIGRAVGALSFRLPLPLVVNGTAVALWFVLATSTALLAAWLPARRAARLTVREALAQI